MGPTPRVCIGQGAITRCIPPCSHHLTSSPTPTISFPPMTRTPLQLIDYGSAFSFELAGRAVGVPTGGDSVTVQVHVADPFNSSTW